MVGHIYVMCYAYSFIFVLLFWRIDECDSRSFITSEAFFLCEEPKFANSTLIFAGSECSSVQLLRAHSSYAMHW
jgi:hypothetical protein